MIPEKRRYNVGVTKIPHRDRDVAHRVMANDDRGFLDIIGADTHDDDDQFPVGSNCTYAVELTPTEAQEFSEASNCRYIEPDTPTYPAMTAPGPNLLSPNGIPTDRTFTWMGCNFARLPEFHGQDVRMCVMDQGTTALVRSLLGINLVGRAIFGDAPANGAELHPDQTHGCLVASNMVPAGGQLLDAMIVTAEGRSSAALFASGVRWACDNGARVINYSFSGGGANQTYTDAMVYMNNFNCTLFIAAGNDSTYGLAYPSYYSRTYPDRVASAIAFDERTGAKASFSNYSEYGTGCAPGVLVLGVTSEGVAAEWSGTSCASPNMATLCGRLQTGGRVTSKQALSLLKQNARNTGQAAQFQGGGAFDLGRVVAPAGGGGDPGDPGSPFALNRNALLALL